MNASTAIAEFQRLYAELYSDAPMPFELTLINGVIEVHKRKRWLARMDPDYFIRWWIGTLRKRIEATHDFAQVCRRCGLIHGEPMRVCKQERPTQ